MTNATYFESLSDPFSTIFAPGESSSMELTVLLARGTASTLKNLKSNSAGAADSVPFSKTEYKRSSPLE